jgi:hypothetical protein
MQETLTDKLALIRRHIDRATTALADGAVSPVTRAVLGEFARKLDKVTAALPAANEQTSRELIVELEQAGDSAKVASDADPGTNADGKKLVEVAHNAICVLKYETLNAR